MKEPRVFYDLDFNIAIEVNGRATYLAKIHNGCCPPYQRKIDENTCQQSFVFVNLKDAFDFIKVAFEEFKSDFRVVDLSMRIT